MSFFDDASLAFLPSGAAGKDGKAYSIKPTDGTGDFTFSRGSNLAATRVGADGLIEKGRENLLTYSNQFDTNWTNFNSSVTSGQSGYDGSNDAWKFNESATTGEHQLKQIFTQSGVNCLSIYAKAAERDVILFRMNLSSSWTNVFFNLTSGSVVSTGGFVDATITSVGNGWYRCEAVFNNLAGSTIQYQLGLDNTTYSYAGESGKGIYIQDSQVEIGLAATPYIESGATTGKAGLLEDEPRFDYSGGVTCPSLLLEPSRTQYIPYTEYFDNAITNVTPTYNYGTSPDGLNNSTFLLPSTAVEAHRLSYSDLFTYASSTSYVASAFFKSGGHRYASLNLILRNSGSFQESASAIIDLETNTIAVNSSNTLWTSIAVFKEEYANGFYRYSITAKTPASGSDRVDVQFSLVDENGNSFAGNGTDGIIIYGTQAEEASYPTSYIPNHSGGTITRGADGSTTGDISSLVNSPEGTIFTDSAKIQDFSLFQLDDGTQNNRITLYPRNNTTQITFILTIGGVQQIRQDPSPSGLDTTQFNKYAIAWGLNDFRVYVNGVNIYSSTSNITFGSGALNDLDINSGKHKQFLLFPEALSDADCISLTTL